MKIKVALNSEKTQYDIICNENEICSAIYEAFNLNGIRISNLEIGENVVYSTGQTISEIEYYITL